MAQKKVQGKVIKFFFGGGLSAFINIMLMIFLIEQLGFDTTVLRNIANIISMEISLIAGFFIYRLLVWTGGSWNFQDVILKQLPLYHISAITAILSRILIVFPLLDKSMIVYS